MTEEARLVPKRRFKEFEDTEEWEWSELREVADFNPKAKLPDEFEYVDLESVVGTDLIAHRTEFKKSAPSRAQRLAQRGDIFYQTVRPYQKNNYLYNLHYDNYVFSTGYAQMRPKIDSYFLFSRVQEETFVRAVLDRSTGTSYPSINSNDLAKIEVAVPAHYNEQVKIGLFFRNLDQLITLHQRKLEKTKALKSAYISEMFPAEGEKKPKRRFAGFTDNWEQKKLIDVAPLQRGFDLPVNEMETGPYPVVMSNGISAYHSKYKTKAPGVVTGRSGTIGNLAFVDNDYWPHNTALWVTDFKGNDAKFIYYMYQKINLKRYGTGSGVPTLNRNDVHDTLISIPCFEEQKLISEFLSNLDNLITLHQRKLEKLQNLKKAYLNEMFV